MEEKEKVLIAILPLETHNFFRCEKHGLFAHKKHLPGICPMCGCMCQSENITPEMVLQYRNELRLK